MRVFVSWAARETGSALRSRPPPYQEARQYRNHSAVNMTTSRLRVTRNSKNSSDGEASSWVSLPDPHHVAPCQHPPRRVPRWRFAERRVSRDQNVVQRTPATGKRTVNDARRYPGRCKTTGSREKNFSTPKHPCQHCPPASRRKPNPHEDTSSQDDRAARGQSGRHLLHRRAQGIVPGGDGRHDSYGLPLDPGPEVLVVRGRVELFGGFGIQRLGETRVVPAVDRTARGKFP